MQPTPVENTRTTTQSVVARSAQTIAASRHTLFSVESPRPRQPVVNTAYEYNTNDIQVILTERFNEHANVSVLAAANMTDSTPPHNGVTDVLSQFMQAGGFMGLTEERHILIPIVSAHHWVGIRLHFIPGSTSLTITYYNSAWNQDFDKALKLKIQQNIFALHLLRALSLRTIEIQSASQCLQQDDVTSCGPFLVENMYCDITKKQWDNTASKPLEERIRIRHLDILQQRRPDYYDRFKQQQAEEVPSTSLRTGFAG